MKKNLIALSLLRGLLPKTNRKLVAFLAVMLFLQAIAFGQTANFLINPASSQLSIGQSFTVNVRVDMVSGSCTAAEVHLNFNPAYLRITNITRPFIGTFSVETIPLPAAPYNTVNSTGHLEYAAGRSSGTTSTDFDLLAITFSTPVSNPQSGLTSITFQNTSGHRTRAALSGSPLGGTLTGGTANICTPPSATIEATSGTSICNSQPVSLRLASATGPGPYSLVVNGNTYNNVSVGPTSFATIPFPTYKIWPSTNPGLPTSNDEFGTPIETGTKFRSTVSGFVKGIRFYSGDAVSGTYRGKLWNFQSSQLLASANFTSVTTDGWQEVMFSSPVSIAANTTYYASYYSSVGNYVATDDFFTSSVTNGPITALANSASPNGMYYSGAQQMGPGTNFNNWSVYQSTNYWVDVIFVPNSNTFNLTSVTSSNGCSITGALQTINVVSADCSSLPVSLLNLSASPQGSKVTLRWATSSEMNNRGFDIERSTDAVNWTTIGFVAGAGNSSSVRNYTYMDQNLEPRKYFYRLKQIDTDDRFKYSAVVSATLNGKTEFSLGQNYPNPFNNQTNIQFILPKAENVNLSLFDVSGRVVRVLVNGSKEAGTHAINFNTGNLTRGVYYYKIQAGDFTDVKKLTIQ